MPIRSPPIAGARYEDVAGRTERLAHALAQWQPPKEGETDVGRALIRVFDRMARHVIERINRIPDQSFRAFLNLVGAEPTPPRPARVPLTFRLVEQRGDSAPIIPPGTRVGAMPAEGDTREIVFETSHELATTRARLSAVLIRQPNGDRWAERTSLATGQVSGTWPAFGGAQEVKHALYLSVDDFRELHPKTLVKVRLTFLSADDLRTWQDLHDPKTRPAPAEDPYYATRAPDPPLVRWSYWNGQWTDLTLEEPQSDNAKLQWQLTFIIPDGMVPLSAGGHTARWIRATLVAWPKALIPTIKEIMFTAVVERSGITPDLALSTGRPVDLSMDFFPLGERPRLNDTFHVASAEVFSKPGATVTVTVSKSDQQAAVLEPTDAPKLTWELSTDSGWEEVIASPLPDTQETAGSTAPNNKDDRFSQRFVLPSAVAPIEFQGQRTHWLRIRLSGGDFGKGVQLKGDKVVDDGYRPPILKKLTLGYSLAAELPAPTCLTYDGFAFTERTGQGTFVPFARSDEHRPVLYLGFDERFAPRDTLLYLQIAPIPLEQALQDAPGDGTSPRISWEYSTSEGWEQLGTEDETRNFARSGVLRFVGPERFAPRSEFGRLLYWLRARLEEGSSDLMPHLGHVLTNTVWATHSATLTGEILGSSDGGTNQSFTLSHRPVLEGQRIEVREPELPPDTERAELERLEGPDAIQRTSEPGRPEESWVRWHEVPDFHASGPRDRHYRIERQTGEVRFGDGQYGMAPPRGVRNVRASRYRTGGGADGNRPVGALNQLKTTIAYVDSVTNLEPAMGGADRENVELLQEHGPRRLRHGGRAVTAEDFEDLAREASPSVARVKALTPAFNPIDLVDNPKLPDSMSVVVLIVPDSPEVPPVPGPGLLQDVETYLRQRCAPAVRLRVIGPDWIQVDTTLSVVPSTLEGLVALRLRVQRALQDFLHPLTGGFEGRGWEPGQLPHESDLYRRVRDVAGIERVRKVTLSLPPVEPGKAGRVLVFSGTHRVSIDSPQRRP